MNVKHSSKILKLETLRRKIAALRKKGKRIAFTNGCFDILHYGHVSYLEKAKGKDRILIIGLNSDSSVKTIKGCSRPIVQQDQRAALLAALSCVDYVTIFDEETPLKVIAALKPDILIKGEDWKAKGAVGTDVVKAHGGRVEFVKYVSGLSTSDIIRQIKKKC